MSMVGCFGDCTFGDGAERPTSTKSGINVVFHPPIQTVCREKEPTKWYTDMVNSLAALGSDPNQLNQFGQAPLCMASYRAQGLIVQELLQRENINVNIKGKHGRTPLYLAAEEGHVYIVKLLLLRPDIDVNCRNAPRGATSLMAASRRGHSRVVELLLQHPDIAPDQADGDGYNAFQHARTASVKCKLHTHSSRSRSLENVLPTSIATRNLCHVSHSSSSSSSSLNSVGESTKRIPVRQHSFETEVMDKSPPATPNPLIQLKPSPRVPQLSEKAEDEAEDFVEAAGGIDSKGERNLLVKENRQPHADNKQYSENTRQILADNTQLQADSRQHSEDNRQLQADRKPHQEDNKQLQADNRQLLADNKQSLADKRQQKAGNKQPLADSRQSQAGNYKECSSLLEVNSDTDSCRWEGGRWQQLPNAAPDSPAGGSGQETKHTEMLGASYNTDVNAFLGVKKKKSSNYRNKSPNKNKTKAHDRLSKAPIAKIEDVDLEDEKDAKEMEKNVVNQIETNKTGNISPRLRFFRSLEPSTLRKTSFSGSKSSLQSSPESPGRSPLSVLARARYIFHFSEPTPLVTQPAPLVSEK